MHLPGGSLGYVTRDEPTAGTLEGLDPIESSFHSRLDRDARLASTYEACEGLAINITHRLAFASHVLRKSRLISSPCAAYTSIAKGSTKGPCLRDIDGGRLICRWCICFVC